MAGTWYLFTFVTNTTEPPTGSQIRFDAVDYATVTKVWIRTLTSDGLDVYYALVNTNADATLYIQDKNDHTRVVEFAMAGTPVDKTTYVELPVTFVQASGAALVTGQDVLLVVVPASVTPPIPPTPLPALVTLDQAKQHLHIVMPAGDPDEPDLQLKLAQAQAIIIDYCNTTTYWRALTATWTSATVPEPVTAAILLELGELWRFRGDDLHDEGPPHEAGLDLSPVIVSLLRRTRDPVLA